MAVPAGAGMKPLVALRSYCSCSSSSKTTTLHALSLPVQLHVRADEMVAGQR